MRKDNLGRVWFLSLGVPLLLVGLVFGCGGHATLIQSLSRPGRTVALDAEPVRPSATAIEGRSAAVSLAARWNAQARLIRVDGWNVRLDGRLADSTRSSWVYTFHQPTDGMYFQVKLDGRGTVIGQPTVTPFSQSLWTEPLDRWLVDSPAVAKMVGDVRLPVGDDMDLQLTRDGVWRLSGEDGQFTWELQIDASTGRRIL